MAIYDISYPLRATLPVWPGDTPFRYTRSWHIAGGASVNLGSVSLSVHAGSHADAPVHFDNFVESIEAADLDVYLGPAQLIELCGRSLITVQDIAAIATPLPPRLLIRTGGWPDPAVFPTEFPVIAPDVPAHLASFGVRLIGLDVPSVDRFDSKELPNHHALHANGIRILESLKLDGVPEGAYELIALPLKIEDGDGSPVRAVLRTVDGSV